MESPFLYVSVAAAATVAVVAMIDDGVGSVHATQLDLKLIIFACHALIRINTA